jgi:hypothetical protein
MEGDGSLIRLMGVHVYAPWLCKFRGRLLGERNSPARSGNRPNGKNTMQNAVALVSQDLHSLVAAVSKDFPRYISKSGNSGNKSLQARRGAA